MKLRTRARIAVLQALYEVDVTGHPAGDVLRRRLATFSCHQREKHLHASWQPV